MTTYFQARDELDRAILDGIDVAGSGPAIAIFRLLLSHTFFKGDAYGWVRADRCGIDVIAKLTGYCERTVKDHLKELARVGLIKRYTRPRATGGRYPDNIFISWSFVADSKPGREDESEEASPALSESPAPSGEASPSTEEASPAPSYTSKEAKSCLQERGASPRYATATSSTGDDDPARAEVTWDGDVSRLIPPPRPDLVPGPRDYYVQPDGHVRLPRGLARPGEVRATIDFLADHPRFRADPWETPEDKAAMAGRVIERDTDGRMILQPA